MKRGYLFQCLCLDLSRLRQSSLIWSKLGQLGLEETRFDIGRPAVQKKYMGNVITLDLNERSV